MEIANNFVTAVSFVLDLPKGFNTSNSEKGKTTVLPTKTALVGLIGAVSSIRRGELEMYQLYDFLIFSEPYMSKLWLETDKKTGLQYIKNKNPKKSLKLRIVAIPTNENTDIILKKFVKNLKYIKGISQKKHLYLGSKDFPVMISKVHKIRVIKQTQPRTFFQKHIVPAFGVEFLESREKWIKISFPVKREKTNSGDIIGKIPVYTSILDKPLKIKAHESYYIQEEERYILPL